MNRRSRRLLKLCPALALLLAAAGCGGPGPSRLVGEWRGRPETAAERLVREAPVAAEAERLLAEAEPIKPTDLESLPLSLMLVFDDGGGVVMTIDGGRKLTGDWRVLSVEGDERIVEIETHAATPPAEQTPPQDSSPEALPAIGPPSGGPEKRRFVVRFVERRDEAKDETASERFVMQEQGADVGYGWLAFERVGGET
ncbi:hypothetical protein Mal64_30820 [Pseudobythopirellula maris]|uniref:Lipocalin-like domain-containing protein n=1 Tax=Pseudobythopirellula maris TaxID=2527991 RepID=A0A5C5ZL58_9BACT|nr:hypothetical protein [Pseudobythopirellula maris]TWT87541.1 hypothetical protein Mal64_30820 [Pseudobythopirellula maris]